MIETIDRKRLEERDCENLDIFFGASTCALFRGNKIGGCSKLIRNIFVT